MCSLLGDLEGSIDGVLLCNKIACSVDQFCNSVGWSSNKFGSVV